jgi:hypothetical protein
MMPGTVPTQASHAVSTYPNAVPMSTPAPRKSRGWLWALIVLLILVPLCGGGAFGLRAVLQRINDDHNEKNSNTIVTTTPTTADADSPESAASPTNKEPAKLTMAKYDQLKIGMPRNEVERILGGPGEEISSSDGGGMTFSVYQWQEEDFTSIILTFRNDKIMSKNQVGLE